MLMLNRASSTVAALGSRRAGPWAFLSPPSVLSLGQAEGWRAPMNACTPPAEAGGKGALVRRPPRRFWASDTRAPPGSGTTALWAGRP